MARVRLRQFDSKFDRKLFGSTRSSSDSAIEIPMKVGRLPEINLIIEKQIQGAQYIRLPCVIGSNKNSKLRRVDSLEVDRAKVPDCDLLDQWSGPR